MNQWKIIQLYIYTTSILISGSFPPICKHFIYKLHSIFLEKKKRKKLSLKRITRSSTYAIQATCNSLHASSCTNWTIFNGNYLFISFFSETNCSMINYEFVPHIQQIPEYICSYDTINNITISTEEYQLVGLSSTKQYVWVSFGTVWKYIWISQLTPKYVILFAFHFFFFFVHAFL